jgi:hypothetical protein
MMPYIHGKWYEVNKEEGHGRRVKRGEWIPLYQMDTPKDIKVDLLMTTKFDWSKATGGKPDYIELGWERVGWGGESVNGSGDTTGARDCPLASKNLTASNATWFLQGGGPLRFRVKIPGTGFAYLYFAEFKVAE